MADRTSAELFARFFAILAENPTEQNKKHALKLFHDARDYDFRWYQMGGEEDLVKLGLARRRIDPEEPDEGPKWFYGPEGADET